jgi:hypothetical protein
MLDVVDFISSYDLKYAFHHIEIFEEHQQYLGKRIIMFLDDSLAGENDYHSAVKSSREVNDQL